MNDLIWIGPALIFGILSTRLGLPPMVGYLIGGFIVEKSDNNDTPRKVYKIQPVILYSVLFRDLPGSGTSR